MRQFISPRLSKTGIRWRILTIALVVLTAALASVAGAQAQTAEIRSGVDLSIPEGWSRLPSKYRNVVELVNVPASMLALARGAYPLHVKIQVEERKSEQDAVERLLEIATEWEGERRFFIVGGWPALDRRYLLPVPQRGQGAGSQPEYSPSITLAVAYATSVVRIEGHLLPQENPQMLDQVVTMASRLQLAKKADPKQTEEKLERLRAWRPTLAPVPRGGAAPTVDASLNEDKGQLTGQPVVARRGSELEVAVSSNGRNVVVATNRGFAYSNDFGNSFTPGGGTPGPACCFDGDPSVSWAQSGAFYYAFIAFPDGTRAWNNTQGCATGISISGDNGLTFQYRSNATLCPQTGPGMCFPDQEHIAADRINAGVGDQIYSVWRNFAPAAPVASCRAIGGGFVTASLVCSQDGASPTGWSTVPVALAGDFPRVNVGSDGFVYVVTISGANVMVDKFSSCASGLVQQAGFPTRVTTFAAVTCPVPGLDRCNNGNTLASPTVAVDDTDPNSVYVAFATRQGAGNEDVVVFHSRDGGATWPVSTTVNSSVTARRFMPWACGLDGTAYVGWYDRRSATAAANDLTEYYVGSVRPGSVGGLLMGRERNLSRAVPDAQCAAGWPCAPRASQDAEGCAVQPQRAGICLLPTGGGSATRCDFSGPMCPAGENCQTGGGCPKYGDYNGIACANGSVYAAWASAIPPGDLAAPGPGINVYAERIDVRPRIVIPACAPFGCRDPVDVGPAGVTVRCDLSGCVVLVPLPTLCRALIRCPGCGPGPDVLCPGDYSIFLDGIEPDAWIADLVDADGRRVAHRQSGVGGGVNLHFRPQKARFKEGQIGDYALLLKLGPKGVVGQAYTFKARVEVFDKPLDVGRAAKDR
jgi:hypothetical protein